MNTAEATSAALVIDGLPLYTTTDDLRELFEAFGSVVWCRVARDRAGDSLRYGYVVMENEANASRAIEALNGQPPFGLPLIVARTEVPPLPRLA